MSGESRRYRIQLCIEYAKLLDCELDNAKTKAILSTVQMPTTMKQSRVELMQDISLMIERLMDMRASLEGQEPPPFDVKKWRDETAFEFGRDGDE